MTPTQEHLIRGRRTASGSVVVLRTMGIVAAAGLLLAGAALLFDGGAAALGALIGVALACGVFGFGTLVVDSISGLQPSASLLIALTTYALQLGVVLVALLALERAPSADVAWSKAWLGGALIAGTMVWIGAQVAMHATARIPAFETPDAARAGAGVSDADGGER